MQHVGKAFHCNSSLQVGRQHVSCQNICIIVYMYHICLQPLPIPWQLFYDVFAKKITPPTHDSGSPHRVQYIGVATTPSIKHSWTVFCAGPVLAWHIKKATLKLTASVPLKINGWWFGLFSGAFALSFTECVYKCKFHALKICQTFNAFHSNRVNRSDPAPVDMVVHA